MKSATALVFVFLITTGAAISHAGDSESERQSLKGVKGIHVVVEDLDAEAEQAGLTDNSIQTDVELRLRQAGIAVLSLPGEPYLYVRVNVLIDSPDVWVYSIAVDFNQSVRLVRDSSLTVIATTWSVGSVGRVGKANIGTILEHVKAFATQFTDAYLSVNPK